MLTWNPLKLYRYKRAWDRLKEADMGKWNSRKLFAFVATAALTAFVVWVNREADLGLKEGDIATLVEKVVEMLIVPVLGAIYMIVQGKVDQEEKKNGGPAK